MFQTKNKRFALKLLSVSLLCCSSYASAVDLRFSGFGDLIIGGSSGKPADAQAGALFNQYGADPYPLNTHKGFTLTGTDFVLIADFSDDIRFLSEVNLQAARGQSSELELDVERMFVDYSLTQLFNVQAGLYFTPIGYFNRFLYSRAWLMNSIQIPDLFEEELNLVPTHTVGVSAYGSKVMDNGHSINYALSLGNGRAIAPDQAVYARDPSPGKELTALVEWIVPGTKDSRYGLSGWTDTIESVITPGFGGSVDVATATKTKLKETGVNPYAVINQGPFSLLAEYVYARQKDTLGTLNGESYSMKGFIGELAVHLNDNKLHPFIRYDRTNLPTDGGPYYSVREDGGQASRVYVPEFKAVMIGAAYDYTVHNRIKFEYIHHMDGARAKHGFAIQSAYGF